MIATTIIISITTGFLIGWFTRGWFRKYVQGLSNERPIINWTPVSEQLPEKRINGQGVNCLVKRNNTIIFAVFSLNHFYEHHEFCEFGGLFTDGLDNVTHWIAIENL